MHDLIKRCNRILEDYEAKLHLVEKFISVKAKVRKMDELLKAESQNEWVQHVRQIAGEILEEL